MSCINPQRKCKHQPVYRAQPGCYVPVRTTHPAAAASARLWPLNPSTSEPPTNATGANE